MLAVFLCFCSVLPAAPEFQYRVLSVVHITVCRNKVGGKLVMYIFFFPNLQHSQLSFNT